MNTFVAAFSSSIQQKFMYMLSAGVEGIWLKAADISNHYFKPRASASLTWVPNDHHSVQFSYELTNTTPDVGMLNPYNTSTDALLVIKGNPYLLPSQSHSFNLSYTYNWKRLYITPQASFEYDIFGS